jgi:hypothetical protein
VTYACVFTLHRQNTALPQPRSPPLPIQPVKTNRDSVMYQHNNKQHPSDRDMYTNAYNSSQYHQLSQHTNNVFRGRDMFEQSGGVARVDRDRRSSVSTHLTDRMERIESEYCISVCHCCYSQMNNFCESFRTKLFCPVLSPHISSGPMKVLYYKHFYNIYFSYNRENLCFLSDITQYFM